MNTYQKQCLLGYLGYNPGQIDGVDGPKTQAAMARFRADYGLGEEGLLGAVAQTLPKLDTGSRNNVTDHAPEAGNNVTEAEKYLRSDGCYHIPRGVDVQLSRNLSAAEIHCQGKGCCQESVISKRIVEIFQAIRDDIGQPLSIGTAGGSGYRCRKHNAEVGGAAGSLHMAGEAVDIHYRDPARLKAVALRHLHDGEVGLYSWGCHVGAWDRGFISEFNGG